MFVLLSRFAAVYRQYDFPINRANCLSLGNDCQDCSFPGEIPTTDSLCIVYRYYSTGEGGIDHPYGFGGPFSFEVEDQ
jgi:hypothetical protein